jgi:EAL domain-containing protein (putative c-di-GMP-specific phosphodiesterase class I)
MTQDIIREIISITFTDSKIWSVIVADKDERIEYTNDTCKDIFDVDSPKILSEIFPDNILQDFRDAIAELNDLENIPALFKECHEYTILKNNSDRLSLRGSFHLTKHTNTPLIVIIMYNTKDETNYQLKTLQQQKTKELEKLLYYDLVTGLKSHQALIRDIGKSSLPTLFLIDINDYSRYIDIYGSEIANELLEMFSQVLEAFNDEKGYEIYHIQADIFCMLHPSEYIDTQKYETDLFELIDTILENPLYIPSIDDTLFIDITIGIASEAQNLLNHAYDALNNAKKNKKRYVYYHPFHDLTKEHKNILKVKKEIQETIEANNFVPVFQAIVNRDREIIKYESLLRMRQGDKLVSPFYFLDIAAKTNQYAQISEITLIQSIETFKDRDEIISLNFTQADINNKELLRNIETLLKKYKMCDRTVFEIVESDAIEDYKFTKEFVNRFRSIGIRIAIDDFGSGYANFSHIMELEPEYLKIDGSLIKNIQNDNKSFIMVKSIIQFAKDLGVKTIAEYIADEDIFNTLLELGADEFQGFYFSKPEPLH